MCTLINLASIDSLPSNISGAKYAALDTIYNLIFRCHRIYEDLYWGILEGDLDEKRMIHEAVVQHVKGMRTPTMAFYPSHVMLNSIKTAGSYTHEAYVGIRKSSLVSSEQAHLDIEKEADFYINNYGDIEVICRNASDATEIEKHFPGAKANQIANIWGV